MAAEPSRCTATKHLMDAAEAQREHEQATPAEVVRYALDDVQYALDASMAESLVDIGRKLGRLTELLERFGRSFGAIADELHEANRMRR
jgi:hypothetical protein